VSATELESPTVEMRSMPFGGKVTMAIPDLGDRPLLELSHLQRRDGTAPIEWSIIGAAVITYLLGEKSVVHEPARCGDRPSARAPV
jgi:hypothetical protein